MNNKHTGCGGFIVKIILIIALIAILIDVAINSMPFEAAKDHRRLFIFVPLLIVLYLFGSIRRSLRRKYTLDMLDEMDGHEFEYACADILKANGFNKVVVTKGSGDFGVDILAEKDHEKYAIQCKCYSKTLGNKPIQEVIGGLAYYDRTVGAVMTNQYFSEGAMRLAEVNDVELWDRDVLEEMIKRTGKRDTYDEQDEYYDDEYDTDDTQDE